MRKRGNTAKSSKDISNESVTDRRTQLFVMCVAINQYKCFISGDRVQARFRQIRCTRMTVVTGKTKWPIVFSGNTRNGRGVVELMPLVIHC